MKTRPSHRSARPGLFTALTQLPQRHRRLAGFLAVIASIALVTTMTSAMASADEPPAPAAATADAGTTPAAEEPTAPEESSPAPTETSEPAPAADETTESGPSTDPTESADTTPTEPTQPAAPADSGPKPRLMAAQAAVPTPCAYTVNPVVFGGFELDGNACVDDPSKTDWDSPAGVTQVDGVGASDSSSFAGGLSESVNPASWSTNSSSPTPAKTDIDTAWAYSHTFGDDVYGYVAVTNDSTAGGAGNYTIEYNKLSNTNNGVSPNRSPGDLLIQVGANGNDPIGIGQVMKWTLQSAPTWVTGCVAISGTSAGWCPISIDATDIVLRTSASGTFVEVGINISSLFGAGDCSGKYGTVNVRSISGFSLFSSSLKDYVAPLSVDTPSTCARIVINKQDLSGQPLGGATFTVSPNPDPTKADNVAFTITDNGAADSDPAAGVIEISPAKPGKDYTITETGAPTGYLLPKDRSQTTGTIGESETGTVTFKDPKIWKPLDFTVSANGSYQVDYAWSIDKGVNADGSSTYAETASANDGSGQHTFSYRVQVTEGAKAVSGKELHGSIDVTNANTSAVTVDFALTAPTGYTQCAVTGGNTGRSVAAGGSSFGYTCTPADATVEPSGGTVGVTMTWSKSAYPQTQSDVDNGGTNTAGPKSATPAYTVTETDKTVKVSDNQHDFTPNPYVITWSQQGKVTDLTYTRVVTGAAGVCTDSKNTATLTGGSSGDKLGEASATATLCVGADLTVTKTADPTLTRTYAWEIDKVACNAPALPDFICAIVKPSLTADVDGKATADYTVRVSRDPNAPTDSAWQMTGTITVKNANQWQAVDLTGLTDRYTPTGGTPTDCVVTDGGDPVSFPVSIPKATGANTPGTKSFDYTCTFATAPNLAGQNLATATWDKAAAATPNASASGTRNLVEGDWVVTKVNDSVDVYDDQATPSKLGSVAWGDAPKTFTYQVTYDATAGQCVDKVNHAWLTPAGTQQARPGLGEDDATVEVCWKPSYTLKKTSDQDGKTVLPGSTITYTLTVKNDSTAPLPSFTVTDDLSDVLNNASMVTVLPADGMSLSGTTLTWTRDTPLAAGQSVDVSYTVKVDDGAWDKTLTNVVTPGTGGTCTAAGDCTTTTTTAKKLAVSKDATGAFTRTYHWTVDKQVRASQGDAWADSASFSGDSYDHEFLYKVALKQGGWTDSAWRMTGTITVKNPNDPAKVAGSITTKLTDTPSVGLSAGQVTCVVSGGADDGAALTGYAVTVASGATKSVDYRCTLDAAPSGTTTNVVTATNANSPVEVPVTFTATTKHNDTVDVYDNKAVGGDSAVGGKLTATPVAYDEAKASGTEVWSTTYAKTHTASGESCQTFKNVARVFSTEVTAPAAGDALGSDSTNAQICPSSGTWTVKKSSDPADGSTVAAGSTVTYTITADKTSSVSPTGVVVVDDLSDVVPHAADPVIPAGSGATYDPATKKITWTIGTLSAQKTLTYTVKIDDDAYGVTIRNVITGDGSSNCPAGSTDPDCDTTHYTPHYTLAKSSDAGATVTPGDVVTYTLTVHNDSDGTLPGFTVKDDLSDVVDDADDPVITAPPAGQTATYDGTAKELTWTSTADLAPNASATLTYQVTVDADAWNKTLKNVATPGTGGDCVAQGECRTTTVTPHYTLAKSSDAGATVMPGDVVTYTLKVHNDSQGTVPGFTVSDDLSDVLDDATLVTPLAAGLAVNGSTLTWTHAGDVAPDGDVTVSYQVKVKADAWKATIKNVVTPGDGGDCVPGECTTTSVTPHYTVEKSASPSGTVMPGDEITYTLKVTNDSQGTLPGFTVKDDLSDVVDDASDPVITAPPAGQTATYDGTAKELTWSSVNPLGKGDSVTLTYKVTVKADAWNATIKNAVTPGDGGDCQPGKCTTTDVTPHYTLAKSSDASGTVMPGDEITYTLTVHNDSDATLPGFTVKDDLSDVVDDASDPVITAPPAGQTATYDGGAKELTWSSTNALGKGDSVTLTYKVTVKADAWNATLKNVVTPGDGGDCLPGECTTTNLTPHYRLAKVSDQDGKTVQPGTAVSYTLTVTNDSETTLPGFEIVDDMSGVVGSTSAPVITAPPAGQTAAYDAGAKKLTWSSTEPLAKGDSVTLTYKVTINADAWNRTIHNVATPKPGTGGDCVTAEQGRCDTTSATPPQVLPPVVVPPVKPPVVKPPKTLPNTGGPGVEWAYGGVALVLLGGGVLLMSRRRRGSH